MRRYPVTRSMLRKDESGTSWGPVPATLRQHPLFSGSNTVGLMSGEQPKYPVQTPGGHEGLASELRRQGLHFEETDGHYQDPERSYIIYGPTEEQMKDLGKRYGQEAIVYSEGGRHKMVYTNGEHEGTYNSDDGKHEYSQSQPAESFWTRMPNNQGFIRLGFDFNTYHPNHAGPPKSEMPQPEASPMALSERTYGAEEIRNIILAALKKSLNDRR